MPKTACLFRGTVGHYSMDDMKGFQNQLKTGFENEGITLKPAAEFPLSLMVDAGYLKAFKDNKMYAGGYLNYAYTKGRLHYSDYSGEAYIDQNINRIVLGGQAIRLLGKGFEAYGKAGFNYSTLKIISFNEVYGGDSNKDNVEFYSLGFSGTAGLGWRYAINKIGFGVNAGYEINIQGKTKFKDSDSDLKDNRGQDIKINWSGARIGLDVSYTF